MGGLGDRWGGLVGANVVWSLAVAIAGVTLIVAPLLFVVVLIPLGIPTAGVYRVAALRARGRPASLGDALDAWRSLAGEGLALSALAVAATTLLGANVVIGLVGIRDVIGVAIATASGWALLALWTWLLVAWPIVADPARSDERFATRARLALGVVLIAPARAAALAVATVVALAVAVTLLPVLLLGGLAALALLGARVALPVADRLAR